MLGDQTGNHSCECVAASAFRQSGIPGGVYPDIAAAIGDKCAPAFEDQDHVVLAREVARHFNAIRFYIFNSASDQSRHLAGVWREH